MDVLHFDKYYQIVHQKSFTFWVEKFYSFSKIYENGCFLMLVSLLLCLPLFTRIYEHLFIVLLFVSLQVACSYFSHFSLGSLF